MRVLNPFQYNFNLLKIRINTITLDRNKFYSSLKIALVFFHSVGKRFPSCKRTSEKPIYTVSKIVSRRVANTLSSLLRYPLFLVWLLASLPIFRSSVPSDIPDAFYRFSNACLAPSSPPLARFIDFRVYVRDAPPSVNPRIVIHDLKIR